MNLNLPKLAKKRWVREASTKSIVRTQTTDFDVVSVVFYDIISYFRSLELHWIGP